MARTSPILFFFTRSRAASHCVAWRTMKASATKTFFTFLSCIASFAVMAMGFSHSTCLPALAAASVSGTWRWFGSGL